MKIISVEDFAIKHFNRRTTYAYFIEGFDTNTILLYNYENRRFLLLPAVYTGNNKENIENEMKSKVSLINKLKIKLDQTANLWQFQLGKARFVISLLSEKEQGFYINQLKSSLLHVNTKNPKSFKAYLQGFADYDDDIWDFLANIEKCEISKPTQLEIPNECYTEQI